jgi:hypothetical protein
VIFVETDAGERSHGYRPNQTAEEQRGHPDQDDPDGADRSLAHRI